MRTFSVAPPYKGLLRSGELYKGYLFIQALSSSLAPISIATLPLFLSSPRSSSSLIASISSSSWRDEIFNKLVTCDTPRLELAVDVINRQRSFTLCLSSLHPSPLLPSPPVPYCSHSIFSSILSLSFFIFLHQLAFSRTFDVFYNYSALFRETVKVCRQSSEVFSSLASRKTSPYSLFN